MIMYPSFIVTNKKEFIQKIRPSLVGFDLYDDVIFLIIFTRCNESIVQYFQMKFLLQTWL